MFKRILVLVLVCTGMFCFSQSGPIGRAIKATQVTANTAGFTMTDETVLQAILQKTDEDIAGLISREVVIRKGDTTVPGGAIIENPAHDYTIFFNTGGSGTEGSSSSILAPGSVIAWPHDTPPAGWLLCNGTAYSTNTYADLFAAIQWRYSAAPGVNFNVPDYRGRVLRGADTRLLIDAGASNRVSSGYGGGSTLAGSTQAGTLPATNAVLTARVEGRIPNTYVNWIIKYRNDTTYFINQVVYINGTSFGATTTNGVLYISFPRQGVWTSGTTYNGSTVQSAWLVSSTTNRTIRGYVYMPSSQTAGLDIALRDARTTTPGAAFFIYRDTRVFGAPLPGSAAGVFNYNFDVPAGYEYRYYWGSTKSDATRFEHTIWKTY